MDTSNLKCDKCSRANFKSKAGLTNHKKICQGVVADERIIVPGMKCDRCGRDDFKSKAWYAKHIEKCDGVNRKRYRYKSVQCASAAPIVGNEKKCDPKNNEPGSDNNTRVKNTCLHKINALIPTAALIMSIVSLSYSVYNNQRYC